jgi:DNA (cytosine-5)-methyltransferase 1
VKREAAEISAIMRRVRSQDTTPEKLLQKALRDAGVRFRACAENLPGRPDIVIPSKRLAIFIDGDFWHGGQWRRRNLASLDDQFRETASRSYWLRKIRSNMDRDCRVSAALLADGWSVVRLWESDALRDSTACIERALSPGDRSLQAIPTKTFAEFFAGIGLMRCALEKHGWTSAYANDIDPKKCNMYRAHFGSGFTLRAIDEVSARAIPTVTLATASCSRGGLDAFQGLINVIDAMRSRRPPLVLVENAPGFLTSHRGRDFEEALLALNRLGYAVDAFLIDAAHFVPQIRQRLFVIGRRIGTSESDEFGPSDTRPQNLVDFIHAHPHIRWSIRRLPPLPSSKLRLADLLDDSAGWWNPERSRYLLDQMSPDYRAMADKMIAAPRWFYRMVFRRKRNGSSTAELRSDRIAGDAREILLKAGRGQYFARPLTPSECARLMGADDYKISGSSSQARLGLGDAVCVPVVEWIAEYYLNPVVNELIHAAPIRM